VTLAELQQGALAEFDRLDTDKDGKISPAERKQVRAELKNQRAPG
jgi:hypothetical protein